MNAATNGLDAVAADWLRGMGKASWEGSLAFLVAWLLCALLPGVTGNLRCWVWRLAFVKLLVALVLWQPINLPLLKARPEVGAGGSTSASPKRLASLDRGSFSSGGWSTGPSQVIWMSVEPAPPVPAQPIPVGVAVWSLCAWGLGVALGGGHLVAQWRRIRRWRRECAKGDDPRCASVLAALCRQLSINRSPALLVHPSYGPLFLGGAAPAIILPTELVHSASEAELQMVLTHELAHLKRHDFYWSAWVTLAQVVFFFHPLVWLSRRQYRLAQELACDELTVRASGASARDYAELLLKVATGHRAKSWSSGALGVLGSGIHLERRLTLLHQLGNRSRRQTKWAASVAILIALGGLAPWRVVAQTRTPEPGKPTSGAVGAEPRQNPTGSSLGEAGIAWEDMLLLQATRYLRLSPSQLQQLLPVARTANRQLTELQRREDKVLESLRRIALRQRDDLVAGRSGSAQEQADAIKMRENALRSRTESERAIVNGSLAGLVRLLTPKQVERAFLLQNGQTPDGEAREPALLDRAAGFVTGPFGGGPMFGFNEAVAGPGRPGGPDLPGNQPSLAQQLMQAQMELSMLQQHLSEPFPPGAVGGAVFAGRASDGKPPKVFRFSTSPDAPPPPLPPGVVESEVLDAEGFRKHLADQTQALTLQVSDLRRQLFTADENVSPEQYQALLQPLARRLFLSPRLQQAVENRLHIKN